MRVVPILAELDPRTWPLRTGRLLLRPYRASDAETSYALRRRPEVAAWAHSIPTDVDTWRQRLLDPAIAPHVLGVEHEGRLVGEAMAHVHDGTAHREVADRAAGCEAELGWLVDPDLQGRGLATEIGRALLGLCFGPLGVRRVVAVTVEPNVASWRVMEKLGMRLEAQSRRDTLHRDLGWVDGRTYALLAEEWAGPEARA